MKKHTSRIVEWDFAERLSEGDVFAVSRDTMIDSINRALGKRDLHTERIYPIDMTRDEYREWGRHLFGVFRVKGKSDGN